MSSADCLDFNDSSDHCRYPQGDAWCQDNNNDVPYAYSSLCGDSEMMPEKSTLFEQFPVTIFDGQPVIEPNFSSNSNSIYFKTKIKKSLNEPANFAGKYNIVEIGCGTACLIWYMVDISNGDIFALEPRGLDTEYYVNSRLIISSSEYNSGDHEDELPSYLLWDEKTKTFQHYQTLQQLELVQ